MLSLSKHGGLASTRTLRQAQSDTNYKKDINDTTKMYCY